jgi:1,2-dihydroxy-3-keto-5-methylthiopentene dioxygenase
MPFRAFYMDSGVEVSEQDLLALGVERFQVNADLIDKEGTEPTLEKICVERNYNYKDVVHTTPETLPNYEEKMKMFFQEHLHTDEEIRLFLSGSGYFDVRDKQDKWIRIHCFKGDMIVLPAGIYHRYSNDDNKGGKVMRFFCGVPVWTPHNRGNETDAFPQRVDYVTKVLKSAPAPYREVLVKSPAEFESEFTAARATHPAQLLVWVTADWCPDCVQAKPVLTQHFNQLKDAVVLKCDVDRNTWKGNPDYPYRTHPQLNVQRIPTLIRFGKQGPRERLVEGECYDTALVEDFFAAQL